MASCQTLIFQQPGQVEVQEGPIPEPSSGELLVRTAYSAVSPGTERLVYEGRLPEAVQLDASISALQKEGRYPLPYGYACAGTVVAQGEEVEGRWDGTSVFCFHPHASHFTIAPNDVIRLPESLSLRDASLIPSTETAINLVMDGRPMIGEKVLVLGQGVIGLLTTLLLSDHPLRLLLTCDASQSRRERSEQVGADRSVAPADQERGESIFSVAGVEHSDAMEAGQAYEGVDLCYELTGDPSVMNTAIQSTGYRGRIVVGSWYGTKQSDLALGGRFHRSRIQIQSSQVSSIDPGLRGRWSKGRRMQEVIRILEGRNVTQALGAETYSITKAPTIYERLSTQADRLLQPIFSYS